MFRVKFCVGIGEGCCVMLEGRIMYEMKVVYLLNVVHVDGNDCLVKQIK